MGSMKTKEREYSATEFKAKCLKILDELGPQGIVVTKRGRPVARVTPVATVDHDRFYGCMKDEIVIKGEIFSTGRKWNAQPRHAHPGLVRRRASKS
jgi:prevent-host-death family protein